MVLFSGDVELGDALISSVEGKANAIEATLLSSPIPAATSSSTYQVDIADTKDDIFE
jgi:hypothetical protein